MWNTFQSWCSVSLPILYFLVSAKPAHGLYCYVCSSDKLELCSTLHTLKELPGELCPTSTSACFTKVEDAITSRGCLSNQMEKGCDDSTCTRCKSDKCNAQIFPEDRLSCLHCEGESCVNQTNTIDVRYPCVKYVLQDECYSIFSYNGDKAYRGCMSGPEKIGRDFCLQNVAQCKKCSKRACNAQPLEFEEKISCIKCTPSEDNDCKTIDQNTTAIECDRTTRGYKNACYIYQNGSAPIRGCLYEASDIIFNECLDYYSEACFTCNQSDCNRAPINDDAIEYNSLYITRAVKNTPFQGCSTPDCNNAEPKLVNRSAKSIQYSDKRLECYRCDGNEDCDFMSSTPTQYHLKPEQCEISSEYDQCYTYIDRDKKMHRGCLSDATESRLMCELGEIGICMKCSSSGCNNHPKRGKPQFSCLKCSDDDGCTSGQNATESVPCTRNVTFGEEETCFTHAIAGTKRVERGCTLDADPNWCQEGQGCERCSKTGCNVENSQNMWCFRCEDIQDDECTTIPSIFKYIDQCGHKSYPHSKRGCFTMHKGKNVTRGCIIDLSEQEYEKCRRGESCTLCTGNYCNKKSFNSSTKASVNTLLGSIMILITYFL